MLCPVCGVETAIRLENRRQQSDRLLAEQVLVCRCRSCENFGRVVARREVEIKQAEEKIS